MWLNEAYNEGIKKKRLCVDEWMAGWNGMQRRGLVSEFVSQMR